jgi:DNA-binding PadR family transcriptional regulator
MASVFVTLDRLEDKGYIASKPDKPAEGRKSRRYYLMRADGREALKTASQTSLRLLELIRHFLKI